MYRRRWVRELNLAHSRHARNPIASATSHRRRFLLPRPITRRRLPSHHRHSEVCPSHPLLAGRLRSAEQLYWTTRAGRKHAALLIDRRDVSKRHDLRAETDIRSFEVDANAIAVADIAVARANMPASVCRAKNSYSSTLPAPMAPSSTVST